MEENLNLIQKLAKISAICDVVKKTKKGFNYTYSDITEILAKVTAGMQLHNVSLIPQIVPQTAKVIQNVVTNTKADKTGTPYNQVSTEMLVTADMEFVWMNNDDPSDILRVPWFLTGSQSDPSQAFGSGLTYCTRYFLQNYFQIAQSDQDVDAYRTKQKEAEKSEDLALATKIVEQFDSMIRQFLSENDSKGEEVKKFVSKYIKGGNYLAIKDPALASKLMTDFKQKYIKEGK